MEAIETGAKFLRAIDALFGALEITQSLVNGSEVDVGLREIAGLDFGGAEFLADAQGALMHGLSTVYVQIGIVEHSEVIVERGDLCVMLTIESAEAV